MAAAADDRLRDHVALEFFSGIGGFHYALRKARPQARVERAFDVDDTAARVYRSNFGHAASVTAMDVTHLDPAALNKLGAGLWMMSPPCQPYTRQGNNHGAKDVRAGALAHMIKLLASPELEPPSRLLLENVVNFESSSSRDDLVRALRARGFAIREYWLSPVHVGIPNQRTRYFLLARTGVDAHGQEWRWPADPLLDPRQLAPWDEGEGRPLPELQRGRVCVERALREYLLPPELRAAELRAIAAVEPGEDDDGAAAADGEATSAAADADALRVCAVPDAIVRKYGTVLDVVCASSRHSCCFTKNYKRYAKGTGSVLASAVEAEEELAHGGGDELVRIGWGLRYLSPREIANLHGFPAESSFPPDVSLRKRYSLLGNSLSVDVVAELLRYLYLPAAD